MVGRIDISSVPAPVILGETVIQESTKEKYPRGEEDVGSDTTSTLARGERDSVTVASTRVDVIGVTLEVGTEAAESDGSSVDIVGT